MKKLLPLVLLALCACGSREEGIRLNLGLTLAANSATAGQGGSRTFTNAQGDRITLTRAHVTLESIEIFACPESSAWRWLRALSPIGTAHAHTVTHPTRLGTPHVTGLALAEGETLSLGSLHPPPNRYCRILLSFGPADADAEGLPSDVDMVGRSLLLEGEIVPASGGEAQPFRLESTGRALAELSLDALSLSDDSPEASRVITLAYDRWLDGVAPASTGASTQALENVAQTASIQ